MGSALVDIVKSAGDGFSGWDGVSLVDVDSQINKLILIHTQYTNNNKYLLQNGAKEIFIVF